MNAKETVEFCDFAKSALKKFIEKWDTLKEKTDELVDEIEALEDSVLNGKPVSADDMYNLKILVHKMKDVF